MSILSDLAKAKVVFQQRAVLSAMGVDPDEQCSVCGDYHNGNAPYICETGDGV